MKKLYLIFGAIFLLIISALSDLVFKRYQSYNYKFNVGLHPIIPWGTEVVAYVVLAILLFFLAWSVLYRNHRNTLTAVLFILLGSLILFTLSIQGYRMVTRIISFPYALPNQVWSLQACYMDIVTSRFAFARNCAAMVMVIGLLRLLPNKKLWPEK